ISGAAALNELGLAKDGGGVGGVLAMIPLGRETMFIGAEAPRNFERVLFKPQPREPMASARLTSSRLSAELPFRIVRLMLSLESNSQPREPMVATTSISSVPNCIPIPLCGRFWAKAWIFQFEFATASPTLPGPTLPGGS